MRPDELIVAVEIPRVEGTQWFRKVGTRAAQAISKIVWPRCGRRTSRSPSEVSRRRSCDCAGTEARARQRRRPRRRDARCSAARSCRSTTCDRQPTIAGASRRTCCGVSGRRPPDEDTPPIIRSRRVDHAGGNARRVAFTCATDASRRVRRLGRRAGERRGDDVGDSCVMPGADRHARARERAGPHRVGRLRDRHARGGGRWRDDDARHAAQLDSGDDERRRRSRRSARRRRGKCSVNVEFIGGVVPGNTHELAPLARRGSAGVQVLSRRHPVWTSSRTSARRICATHFRISRRSDFR